MVRKMMVIGLSTAMLLTAAPSAIAEMHPEPIRVPDVVIGGNPVPANVKISREDALTRAKSYITIPDDYKLKSMNYYENSLATRYGVWNFEFKTYEKDVSNTISVTIDSDSGALTEYSRSYHNAEKLPSDPPKVSLQQAKQIGEQILKKYNPKQADKMLYNDEFDRNFTPPADGNVTYVIRFDRSENGVRFPSNSISIGIDASGRFVWYNKTWNDTIQFDIGVPLLTQADAEKAFREQWRPQLSYETLPNPDKTKSSEPTLTYNLNAVQIDPMSGALLHEYTTLHLKPIADKPLAKLPDNDLKMTQEQAITKLDETIGIPEGGKLYYAVFNEYDGESEKRHMASWNLTWVVGDSSQNNTDYASAIIDANTGEIINYNYIKNWVYRDPNESLHNTLTLERGRAKALEVVKKILPHYLHELAITSASVSDQMQEQMHEAELYFRRVISDVPAGLENVSIRVNLVNGDVVSFNNQLSKLPYPANRPQTIDVKTALEKWLSLYYIELQYTLTDNAIDDINEKTLPNQKTGRTAKLVYQLVPRYDTFHPVILDAVTGEWKSTETGKVTTPIKNTFTLESPTVPKDKDEIGVKINGKLIIVNPKPMLVNGSTFIPLRGVFEATSATVTWDDNSQSVLIERKNIKVKLTIGKKTAYVNGNPVQLNVAPFISTGSTYVPLRFISETIGAKVDWDNESRIASIEIEQ